MPSRREILSTCKAIRKLEGKLNKINRVIIKIRPRLFSKNGASWRLRLKKLFSQRHSIQGRIARLDAKLFKNAA